MPKSGRPRKEIDWQVAETAAALHCNGEEIAALCKVSYDTLERRIKEMEEYDNFADWYKIHSADAKKALRRWQMESAKKGNAALLIWLGKQYLGQKEPKTEIEQTDKKVYVNVFENENPIRKKDKVS